MRAPPFSIASAQRYFVAYCGSSYSSKRYPVRPAVISNADSRCACPSSAPIPLQLAKISIPIVVPIRTDSARPLCVTVGAVRTLDAPAAVKVSPQGDLDRTVKWREAAAKTGSTPTEVGASAGGAIVV